MSDLAFSTVFGKPIIFYMGILTYLTLVSTALIQILNRYMKTKIPLKWHQWLAYTSLVLATLHGLMGISIYL